MNTDHHVILRVVSKLLIPVILLYAFYVHFHGEYSAGGGFQAGVIFAVAIILYALIFGVTEAMRAIPPTFARFLALSGVLIYGGTGVAAMLLGGEFLNYSALVDDAPGEHWGQHIGIILIEIGVLFAVAGSMLTIFYAFAGRAPEISDEDW